MEKNTKNEIYELLGDIKEFIPDIEFEDENLKNPDDKVIEKYFNIKLKNQLDAANPFSNIKIKISEFIDDLNIYMCNKVLKNDKINKKVAKNILKQINEYFKDENEILINSVFTSISGEKIQNFFDLINHCSYPQIEIEKVDPKVKYTILVESAYCLQKNIIKKTEQLGKSFLFFSVMNKFYKKYKEYLEDFYEIIIKKYIFSNKKANIIYNYEKVKDFHISDFDNFIILLISNSQFKLFNEASQSISISKSFEQDEIEFNIEKCFQFPLKRKGPKDVKKTFSGDDKENNLALSGNEKEGDTKLIYGYKKFKYLIENINLEKNFKVKLVYFDLYLNLREPKSDIMKKLDIISKTVTYNMTSINNKINSLEDKLDITYTQTKGELTKLKKVINSLVEYIHQKDSDFTIENLK